MHTIEHALSATSTESLGVLAVAIGLTVRILKSRTMGAWLDGLPPEWLRAVPRSWLPRIAIGLGALVLLGDAYTHGGVHGWRDAANVLLSGLMAGALPVAGHEALVRTKTETPKAPDTDPTPKSEEKPS